MFTIFPFEGDFYARYGYNVHYTGNPTVDELARRPNRGETFREFIQKNSLSDKPIVALLAGSRSQEYSRTLTTKVGFLSAEHSWETFRASYSFQVERSPGVSLAPSQALQLDYLYSPGDSIGFSYTAGREVADFGTLGILNTEVRSVGVRGQHWFKKDWAFTYQAGHGDHGSMPAREAVQLGLRRSF